MKKTKNIFGTDIQYKREDLSSHHICGHYQPEKDLIVIDKSLKGTILKHTILHEEIHAIFDKCGVNQTSVHFDIQEILCEQISKFIVDNYHLREK